MGISTGCLLDYRCVSGMSNLKRPAGHAGERLCFSAGLMSLLNRAVPSHCLKCLLKGGHLIV